MKWLIVILAICVVSQAAPNFRRVRKPTGALKVSGIEEDRSSRIYQADGNADPTQFPYHAYILTNNLYLFGGALISEEYVLTSAEAISGYVVWTVTLGATVLSAQESWVQTRQSISSIAHYTPASDNIGVIRITAVELTEYVKPALLPRYGDASDTFEGRSAIATGFGMIGLDGGDSDILRYIRLSVLSNSECDLKFGFALTAEDLCAEGTGNTCPGDNGGALVVEETPTEDYTIIGIIAFGGPNCEAGLPTGFSRVTSYLSWINANTGITIIP